MPTITKQKYLDATEDPSYQEPLRRLRGDLLLASRVLDKNEVSYLVDFYQDTQQGRIAAKNRMRAYNEGEEPNQLINWTYETHLLFETVIKAAMDAWTDERQIGRWMKSITGIGPVITAGIISNINFAGPNVGHLWTFAGLAYGQKWEKGKKRPWNASLKRLAFIAGDCFVKFKNHPKQSYGTIYDEYKTRIQQRNDRGEYAERSVEILASKRWKEGTVSRDAYEHGRLPDGHVQMMAIRHVAKIFFSHVFECMYWEENHQIPPRPYVIEESERTGGMHNEYLGVPHLREFYPDFWEAKREASRLGIIERREGEALG